MFPSGVDVMRPDEKFPVVEAAPLSPVTSRWFRPTRRQAGELPEPVGGSVLVFQANDRFALAPTGPRMLRSDVVVKATMVAVVLTRAQVVPAVAMLPSVDPNFRLGLRATYQCQVTDPVRVLEGGCWDVRGHLMAYLLGDAKIRMLSLRHDVDDNPEVQQRILARAMARNELEPLVIPGMRLQLVEVSVVSHRAHASWEPPEQRRPAEDQDNGFHHRDRYADFDVDNGRVRPRDGYGN